MMLSQKNTKTKNMNGLGKSQLKRQITHEKNEPLDKFIKIGDEAKIKLNNMKKADLVRYCEEILEENNNLMKENKKFMDSEKQHLKTIEGLEENVKNLKHDMYHCGECDYIADCLHDFNDHTHSPEDLNNIENSNFICKFCEESFQTLSEVMRHNKVVHTSHVQHCDQFLENICSYGENCWFLHSELFKKSEPGFQCNFCEQKFVTKNALRKHSKKLHIQSVPRCKSEIDCKFSPKRCWFVHKEDIEFAYHTAKSKCQI